MSESPHDENELEGDARGQEEAGMMVQVGEDENGDEAIGMEMQDKAGRNGKVGPSSALVGEAG